MRSPIAKKIWETHECEKFWFVYDVTSVRPTARTQSHNANAPAFVWREVAFTAEMLKNTKYKVNLCVFAGYVKLTNAERRERERKRKQKKWR